MHGLLLRKAVIELTIPDMTCGHCASTVKLICRLIDARAKVDVDVERRLVKIMSDQDSQDFAEALAVGGYPPAR
ncbi:heavy metal transporter [Ramlibacter sp. Leaf400]|nr:heavy metal transporter [Ramlibacter sp. Leaf400]